MVRSLADRALSNEGWRPRRRGSGGELRAGPSRVGEGLGAGPGRSGGARFDLLHLLSAGVSLGWEPTWNLTSWAFKEI